MWHVVSFLLVTVTVAGTYWLWRQAYRTECGYESMIAGFTGSWFMMCALMAIVMMVTIWGNV